MNTLNDPNGAVGDVRDVTVIALVGGSSLEITREDFAKAIELVYETKEEGIKMMRDSVGPEGPFLALTGPSPLSVLLGARLGGKRGPFTVLHFKGNKQYEVSSLQEIKKKVRR